MHDARPVLFISQDVAWSRTLTDACRGTGLLCVTRPRALNATDGLKGAARLILIHMRDPIDLRMCGELAHMLELPEARGVPLMALTDNPTRVAMLLSTLKLVEALSESTPASEIVERIQAATRKRVAVDAPLGADLLSENDLNEAHLNMGCKNYFLRLGVGREAQGRELKDAYDRAMHKYRFDAMPGAGSEQRRMIRGIQEALRLAYEALATPHRRTRYVQTLEITQSERVIKEAQNRATAEAKRRQKFVTSRPEVRSAPPSAAGLPSELAPEPVGDPRAWVQKLKLSADGLQLPNAQAKGVEMATMAPPKAKSGVSTGDDGFWDGLGPKKDLVDEALDAARLQAVAGDYTGALDICRQAYGLYKSDEAQAIFSYRIALYSGLKAKYSGELEQARDHFKEAVSLAPTEKSPAHAELLLMENILNS